MNTHEYRFRDGTSISYQIVPADRKTGDPGRVKITEIAAPDGSVVLIPAAIRDFFWDDLEEFLEQFHLV